MPGEIGSWREHENSGRFVGSRPRERRGGYGPFSVAAVTLANTGDSGEAERSFRRQSEQHSGMIPNAFGA